MNDLQIFSYEGAEVRTVWVNDELWWVLKDVCRVLSIVNSHDAASRLDDDEKGVGQIYTPGGFQDMNIINESGLYNVILRSDKPEAKKFRRWVLCAQQHKTQYVEQKIMLSHLLQNKPHAEMNGIWLCIIILSAKTLQPVKKV